MTGKSSYTSSVSLSFVLCHPIRRLSVCSSSFVISYVLSQFVFCPLLSHTSSVSLSFDPMASLYVDHLAFPYISLSKTNHSTFHALSLIYYITTSFTITIKPRQFTISPDLHFTLHNGCQPQRYGLLKSEQYVTNSAPT